MVNYDPDKWPIADGAGQPIECDPILGCQPLYRSAFDRMMAPVDLPVDVIESIQAALLLSIQMHAYEEYWRGYP